MSCEPFGQNQIDSDKIQWNESNKRFTEPVRYFKSNDPYYWEVDNIPIKQLEENVLWLKDQLGAGLTSFELSGIGRKDFSELKPIANGSTRKVQVLPGKFLARINDAYFKGIGSVEKVNPGTFDLGSVGSEIGFLEKRSQVNFTTSVLRRLVGAVLGNPLYNNGLYDHIQHHAVSKAGDTNIIDWSNISVPSLNTKLGIHNIPKNKLALWRQANTSTNFGNSASDLQQLSVDLTRAWGGTTRTALVNVKETLEIEIPDFSQNDYLNSTNYTPRVRFDLLFIYSHPADSETTTIAASTGDSPTVITTPQLGIVKGAGVVKLRGAGLFASYDSEGANSASFFDNSIYTENITSQSSYFKAEDGMDDDKNYQISSPMSDNNQTNVGVGGVFGNLPSPDDLMNLAPLLQESLSDSFSLIGQSVLPIAYVVVREGQAAILNDDIIDIRPFFRTAELAYNERAGVAAANPPLSLANPAVGKHELSDSIQKSTNYLLGKVFALETLVGGFDHVGDNDSGAGTSVFITKGAVLGGTMFGVEGALLHLENQWGTPDPDTGATEINTTEEAIEVLKSRHLPGLTHVPILPGWDTADWAQGLVDEGLKRNDRIHWSARAGARFWTSDPDSNNSVLVSLTRPVVDNNVNPSARVPYTGQQNLNYKKIIDYDLIYYIKKRISLVLPDGIVDYDVNCNFVSCIPATGTGRHPSDSHPDGGSNGAITNSSGPRSTNNYGGIFVEKHGRSTTNAEFTIFVSFVPGVTNMVNELNHWGGLKYPESTTSIGTPAHNSLPFSKEEANGVNEKRDSHDWSAFRVLSNLGPLGLYGNRWDRQTNPTTGSSTTTFGAWNPKCLPPMMVTYPTVEFSITGYSTEFAVNYISDSIAGEVPTV
tara:strand:- start:994 stop:3627 length:2634 start_codon:yes stop_codon:yes gene_type:complete